MVIGYNTDNKMSASMDEGKWTVPINIISKYIL